MNILAAIANDPNISPSFRKAIDTRKPSTDLLSTAFDKAAPRRFTGAPPTGFSSLDEAAGLEPVICGDCDGSGEGMHDGASCGTCEGEGEVLECVDDADGMFGGAA